MAEGAGFSAKFKSTAWDYAFRVQSSECFACLVKVSLK